MTQEDEAKALLYIIINSALKKLALTGFSTSVNLRSFIISLDLATALKSTQILFQGVPNNETVSVLLASFHDAPELNEFMFSKNHLGEVLSGQDRNIKFARLVKFMKRAEKLKFLDLSDNALFTGPEDQYKHGIFDVVKDRQTLNVDMRGNLLDPVEETSQKYFLLARTKEIRDKRSTQLEKHTEVSHKKEALEAKWSSICREYEALSTKPNELEINFKRTENRRTEVYEELEKSRVLQKRIESIEVDTFVRNLGQGISDREIRQIDQDLTLLLQDLEKAEKNFNRIASSFSIFESNWLDDIRKIITETHELRFEEVTRRKIKKEAREKEKRKKRSELEALIEERDRLRNPIAEVDSSIPFMGTILGIWRANTSQQASSPQIEELERKIRRLQRDIENEDDIFSIGHIGSNFGAMDYGVAHSIGNSAISIGRNNLGDWSSASEEREELQVTKAPTKPVAEVKVDHFAIGIRKVHDWIRSAGENRVSTVYVAHDPEMEDRETMERLFGDLVGSGLFDHVFRDEGWGADRSTTLLDRIGNADKVIVIGSRNLKKRYDTRKLRREDIGVVSSEMDAIRIRLFEKGDAGIVPLIIDNQRGSTSYHYSKYFFPTTIKIGQTQANYYDFFSLDNREYGEHFFGLLKKIYNPSSEYNHPIEKIRQEFRRAIEKY